MTEEWASLTDWIGILAHHIDTGDYELSKDDILTLLDLARDASHQVERAASPLTTFLVGVAVGRGASLGKVAAQTTALVLSLDDLTGDADGETDPGAGSGADAGPEADALRTDVQQG